MTKAEQKELDEWMDITERLWRYIKGDTKVRFPYVNILKRK